MIGPARERDSLLWAMVTTVGGAFALTMIVMFIFSIASGAIRPDWATAVILIGFSACAATSLRKFVRGS